MVTTLSQLFFLINDETAYQMTATLFYHSKVYYARSTRFNSCDFTLTYILVIQQGQTGSVHEIQ